MEGFFTYPSKCILKIYIYFMTNIYATGENMFHVDSIQRKLFLIIGAVILAVSIGLIYKEISGRTDNPLQEAATGEILLQEQQEDEAAETAELTEPEQQETIQIYITGQVKRPGVYTIAPDKRLIDAIELAGGCTPEADLNRINLAARVVDEGMYYVPAAGEEIDPGIPAVQTGGEAGTEKININTADENQLQTLTGIGPAKAQKIIEYREANGGFKSIEEIMNVSGIGEKTFENIKENICVR